MSLPLIIKETSDYFVINKPAGYSVEPHPNYPSISDWLNTLYRIYAIKNLDRFGLVHRLDVETSGVLIWAKTTIAQKELQKAWQGRVVKKTYLALVVGETPEEGSVELAIERDNRHDRQRVTLLPSSKARPAITSYKRLAVGELKTEHWKLKTGKLSLLECHPITGRTHQIRVHLKYLGHPVVGDKLYGNKATEEIAKELNLHRHFLHETELCLLWQGMEERYSSPLPPELVAVLRKVNISFGKQNSDFIAYMR